MRLALALVGLLSAHAHSHEGRRTGMDQAAALQSTGAFERLYDGGLDYTAAAIEAPQQAARANALTFARAAKPRSASSVPPLRRLRNTSDEKRGNIPLTGGLLLAVGWGGVMGTILYRARPLKKQR